MCLFVESVCCIAVLYASCFFFSAGNATAKNIALPMVITASAVVIDNALLLLILFFICSYFACTVLYVFFKLFVICFFPVLLLLEV